MVKRFCVMFPDGSLNIHAVGDRHPTEIKNEARQEAQLYNKNERDPQKLARFGEIEINLISFKELT